MCSVILYLAIYFQPYFIPFTILFYSILWAFFFLNTISNIKSVMSERDLNAKTLAKDISQMIWLTYHNPLRCQFRFTINYELYPHEPDASS